MHQALPPEVFFLVLTSQNHSVIISKSNMNSFLCCPTGERSSTQRYYGCADSLFGPMQEAEQRQSLPWRTSKHCLMSTLDPALNGPELTLVFRCFPHFWNLRWSSAHHNFFWEAQRSLLCLCDALSRGWGDLYLETTVSYAFLSKMSVAAPVMPLG